MRFEWPIFPMTLKLLPHGQLISLVKRQKSNLDRKGRKRASEVFFRMVVCTEHRRKLRVRACISLEPSLLSCPLGEFLQPLGQLPSCLNTLHYVKKCPHREKQFGMNLSHTEVLRKTSRKHLEVVNHISVGK